MKHSANSPDLAFAINPGTVNISANPSQSSYTNLTVTVTNNGADTLTVKGVTITLPDTLAPVSTLKTIVPTAAQANLWNFHPSPFTDGEFDASPASGSAVTLKGGDTWTFMLTNVTLVHTITQTPANVGAAVYFADNTNTSQNLPVNIAVAKVGIDYFTATLPEITPGQSTTLNWQCPGMDYCLIIPGDGSHLSPDGTESVEPSSSTTYTLYAYGAGAIISAQFNITVENPQILSFSAAEGEARVDLNSKVTLTWRCNEFTDSIEIVANTSVNIPQQLGDPHNGSVSVGPMIAPTTFTMRAFAKDKTIYTTQTAAVGINDVTAALTVSPATGLWVQDEITLTWNITNATEVTLSPEIPDGPSLQKLSGTITYSPPAGVTSLPIKLTAKGFVDDLKKTVTNQPPIVLELQPVTIIDFSITPSVIHNGGTPNQATLAWNTQAQNVSIDKFGTVKPVDSQLLSAPANGTVYMLSAGTSQHPNIISKQVQVINCHGPFTFNSFSWINNQYHDVCFINANGMDAAGPLINQPCTIVITGVHLQGSPPPNPIGNAYLTGSRFSFEGMGPITWIDPNNPTGTITVIS